jgi:hypothetical protein
MAAFRMKGTPDRQRVWRKIFRPTCPTLIQQPANDSGAFATTLVLVLLDKCWIAVRGPGRAPLERARSPPTSAS